MSEPTLASARPSPPEWAKLLGGTPRPKGDSNKDRLDDLRETDEWLRRYRARGLLLLFLSTVLALAFLRLWSSTWAWWFTLVLCSSGALALWLMYYFSPSAVADDIRALEIEVDIERQPAAEGKAFRLFKLHQLELQKYYRHTLRHSRVLMFVGLVCLLAGLFIVGAAVWAVFRLDLPQQKDWLVAALGAIGGILANYVAAVYLRMHAGAAQSLNDFHSRLVSTHRLHFANFLASKIATQDKLEATLQKMAEELAAR